MKLCFGALVCMVTVNAGATELRIAVAANFLPTMEVLAQQYSTTAGPEVLLSSGSTGKLYAQIVNSAPYDVFFAADTVRPALLEKNGQAVTGSRFSYALGRLVLWSPLPGMVQSQPPHFAVESIRFFSIANPELAPYGAAARETLLAMGTWEALQDRLVRGENITQTFQFVITGNATAGMVARSQLVLSEQSNIGSAWLVPATMHAPIEQQAVVISDTQVANEFAAFVRSDVARKLISEHGYDLPPE